MKKIIYATLVIVASAGMVSATEFYKESFEDGLGSWYLLQEDVVATSVGSPEEAVTDGTNALKFAHTDTSGIIELARLSHGDDAAFFAALKDPKATTMSIDFFVPAAVTVGTTWSQFGLRLQIDGSDVTIQGFPTMGVDSMGTVDFDLTNLGVSPTNTTWADVTLNYHGATSTSRSPIYVDRFRIHDGSTLDPAFYTDSFEGEADGWVVIDETPGAAIGFVSTPVEAVTDELQAMELSHSKGTGSGQADIAKIDSGANPAWFVAIKSTNTPVISVDVHVPAAAIANFWTTFSMAYQGGFANEEQLIMEPFQKELTMGVDNTFTAKIVFTDEQMASVATSTWGQVVISMNGGDSGTISPVYLDNFRVHDSVAAGYDAWLEKYPTLADGEKGMDADPDGDNLNNLYEYGLDGNPTNAAVQGISPIYSMDSGVFTYIYPQRLDSESGISYHLELNTDLVTGTWTNDGYTVTGTGTIDEAFDAVTNATTMVGSQKFIQLIIEAVVAP